MDSIQGKAYSQLATIPDDPGGGGSSVSFKNPLSSEFTDIWAVLNAVMDVIIQVAFPIVVLALVYAGFLFVFAQGKPEDLSKARNIFLWTVVGALVVLGAKVLAAAIAGTVGEITG